MYLDKTGLWALKCMNACNNLKKKKFNFNFFIQQIWLNLIQKYVYMINSALGDHKREKKQTL